MKDEIGNVFKSADGVRMMPEEKSLIKEKLLSYAKVNSIQTDSQKFWFGEIFIREHAFVVAFIVVILTSSGTIAFAEKTLPGDLLYPLKTGVSEQVRGWFAVSTEAKGEWQLTLADRRLGELDLLSEKEGLSEEVKNKTEDSLEKHLATAQSLLDFEKDTETAESFIKDGAREIQTMVTQKTSEESTPTVAMTKMVEEQTETLAIDTETPTLERPLIDRINEARVEVRRLKDNISDNKEEIGSKMTYRALFQILNVEKKIYEAKIALKNDDWGKAADILDDIEETLGSIKTLVDSESQDPVITDKNRDDYFPTNNSVENYREESTIRSENNLASPIFHVIENEKEAESPDKDDYYDEQLNTREGQESSTDRQRSGKQDDY